MATPTPDEIRTLLSRHVQFWNEDRFDDWIALWPDDIVNEDPNGVTKGKEAVSVAGWKRAQPICRLGIKQIAVLGNEGAAVVSNTLTLDAGEMTFDSIEIYTFGADGSLRVRVFYDPPEG